MFSLADESEIGQILADDESKIADDDSDLVRTIPTDSARFRPILHDSIQVRLSTYDSVRVYMATSGSMKICQIPLHSARSYMFWSVL